MLRNKNNWLPRPLTLSPKLNTVPAHFLGHLQISIVLVQTGLHNEIKVCSPLLGTHIEHTVFRGYQIQNRILKLKIIVQHTQLFIFKYTFTHIHSGNN